MLPNNNTIISTIRLQRVLMSEAEAIVLLAKSKGLAEQLLLKDGFYTLSASELNQLRAVQQVVKAGWISCLNAAGVSLDELIILLGTLKLYDHGTWPLPLAQELLYAEDYLNC